MFKPIQKTTTTSMKEGKTTSSKKDDLHNGGIENRKCTSTHVQSPDRQDLQEIDISTSFLN